MGFQVRFTVRNLSHRRPFMVRITMPSGKVLDYATESATEVGARHTAEMFLRQRGLVPYATMTVA